MITRRKVEQHTFANTVIAALDKTLKGAKGICEQVEVIVNDNDGNKTATVAITTDNSGTLFSVAGIAENATTILHGLSHKATRDASFNPFLVSGSDLTVTVTPSGDPGSSGMTVDVYLYLRTDE